MIGIFYLSYKKMITVTSIKLKILFAFLQTILQKNFRQFLFDDFFINRGIRTLLIFELQHSYTVFLQAYILYTSSTGTHLPDSAESAL